jgi:hypothetical protein
MELISYEGANASREAVYDPLSAQRRTRAVALCGTES